MHFSTWTLGTSAMAVMMIDGVWTRKIDYAGSLQALSYGNVPLQGNSTGTVWFNVTDFAVDVHKLPYIQTGLGIFSLDNFESLEFLVDLAETAASKSQYGDFIYLYNAFAMNAHVEYVKVSSKAMQEGLLVAVTPPGSNTPDQNLIKLYADTCSSPSIRQTFLGLEITVISTSPASPPQKRYTGISCSDQFAAARSACDNLRSLVTGNFLEISGGPRDVCLQGCCISWSGDADFQLDNLHEAADACSGYCTENSFSCVVNGVELQGTIVNQCLSNRPDGCT